MCCCREDPNLIDQLKQNPEEGKVRVLSTSEGDINTATDWFKGGRPGPALVFAATLTKGNLQLAFVQECFVYMAMASKTQCSEEL